eukprot:m.187332 g.187332  ORF g.187332 m.187332 type:complete len:53 (+) comp24795_c1_seq1:1278-1436(+)
MNSPFFDACTPAYPQHARKHMHMYVPPEYRIRYTTKSIDNSRNAVFVRLQLY